MESNDRLFTLYLNLKNEITELNKMNSQLLLASITATGTILTVGFTSNTPINLYIFFCAFVFIYPISRMVVGNRKNIWRISTYMRVFIEDSLGDVQWETRLLEQRKLLDNEDQNHRLKSKFVSNEIHVFSLLSLVSMTSIGIMFFRHYVDGGAYDYLALAVFVISVIFCLIILRANINSAEKIKRGGKIEKDFLNSWTLVKAEEDKNKNQ